MARHRRITRRSSNPNAQIGLTLVELLVVMTILALATSVVILNAPPSRPPARDAAEEFAMRLRQAFDAAIIDGADYRLEALPAAYRFLRFDEGEWTPAFGGETLRASDDVVFRLSVDDAAASNALALNGDEIDLEDDRSDAVFVPIDPLGSNPAISAYFESRRGGWLVRMSADGAVSVDRL